MHGNVLCLFIFSAKDIKELKIVKSATDAHKDLPKKATPSKLSKETAEELGHVPSPGRIREVTPNTTREVTPVDYSEYGLNNGPRYNEKYNLGASPGVSSGNYTLTKDRYIQEGNGHVSPLRHTPTKDRGDESNYRSRGGQNRDRSEEAVNGVRNGNGARYTPTKDDHFRGRKNSGRHQNFKFSIR